MNYCHAWVILRYIRYYEFACLSSTQKPDDPNQFFKLDDEGKKIMENVPIVDTWKVDIVIINRQI